MAELPASLMSVRRTGELIPSHPCHGVVGADGKDQARGHFLQKGVADGMAGVNR